MGLFLKNPKTCMDPWHALAVLVGVCVFVLVSLFLGRQRFEANLVEQNIHSGPIASPGGSASDKINPSDSGLRLQVR